MGNRAAFLSGHDRSHRLTPPPPFTVALFPAEMACHSQSAEYSFALVGPHHRDDLLQITAVIKSCGSDSPRLFLGQDCIVPPACIDLPLTLVDPSLRCAAVEQLIVAECLLRQPAATLYFFVLPQPDVTKTVGDWIHSVKDLVANSVDPSCLDVYVDCEQAPNLIGLPLRWGQAYLSDLDALNRQSQTASNDTAFGERLLDSVRRAGADVRTVTPTCRTLQQPMVVDATAADRLKIHAVDVSIVVPTWNCADYLADCIDSLLGQSVAAEVIVVDDASSDQTSGVLASFKNQITVIRHANRRGANAARNTAIAAAAGNYIAFADADNVYDASWLEKLLAALLADRSAALAYCGYTKLSADGTRTTNPAAVWDIDLLWYGNYIDMSSVVRRSAIPPGGLPEGFRPFDDWRLWLMLARSGWTGAWVPEKLFIKHVRSAGKTGRSMSNPQGRSRDVAAVRREFAGLVGLDAPIAVVIPGCGSEDLTAQCIAHLGDYSGVPLDIVYVDNGSPLTTIDAVAQAADAANLMLRVVRNQTNRGFTVAINQGINACAHQDVLLLNNDCFVGPNCVENLARELQFNQPAAAVGPITGDDGKQSLKQPLIREMTGQPASVLEQLDDPVHTALCLNQRLRSLDQPVLSFYCALLRRSAIDRYGGLDEQFASGLAADDEWCFRVRRFGRQVRVVLNAYATHLHRSSFKRLKIERDQLQQEAQQRLHQILADAED
ncbi:glycosyltransferase [Stieleria sp. TO1_6]|uniref:glycosyltransferase n=1 Tax=Stieleria tagensis TaxID=2956795 RepID=UPI00209B7E32|nr:glycosyltransferase [Stieleria tagensis]MCO8122382.1 glycosyltransferase [Stieleria tagensis]